MRASRLSLVALCATLLCTPLNEPLFAVEAHQPGVVLQVTNNSNKKAMVHIQREAGIDRESGLQEGHWHLGNKTGQVWQGIFRGNNSTNEGQRRLYVRILAGPDPSSPVKSEILVDCTPTESFIELLMRYVNRYGICSATPATSTDIFDVQATHIDDTGYPKPAGLKLLILKINIKKDTW